jgi:ribosomal protein S18 acetylase RimI-like enzyme
MLQLKRVTEADILDLAAIAKATFYHTYSYSKTEEMMTKYINDNFSIDVIKEKVANKNTQFYFAMENDKIVGYIQINQSVAQTDLRDEDNLEIERLYVNHEEKGKGIGRFLCESMVPIGQSLGKKYIWLGVWDENEKAMAFYKKIGYVPFGEHPFYFEGIVENDILLKKVL